MIYPLYNDYIAMTYYKFYNHVIFLGAPPPRLHQGLIGSSCANLLPLQQLNTQACRNVVPSCRRAVEDQSIHGELHIELLVYPRVPFHFRCTFVDCHLLKKTHIVICWSSLFLVVPPCSYSGLVFTDGVLRYIIFPSSHWRCYKQSYTIIIFISYHVTYYILLHLITYCI